MRFVAYRHDQNEITTRESDFRENCDVKILFGDKQIVNEIAYQEWAADPRPGASITFPSSPSLHLNRFLILRLINQNLNFNKTISNLVFSRI